MRTLAFIVVLAFFASCTGPQMLTHHKVSYEVTAEHEDQRSNAYLQKQQLGFEVRFKGDSFYAFYQYGNSQLQHYGLDVDTAILAIRYDKTRYVSFLGAGSIDQYLSLRSPYEVRIQPGKVQYDSLQCKKALIIYPDGSTTELLFAIKLKPGNALYDYGFKKVNGLPVKFSTREGKATYHFELKHIEDLPAESFPSLTIDRYEVVPLEMLLNEGSTW